MHRRVPLPGTTVLVTPGGTAATGIMVPFVKPRAGGGTLDTDVFTDGLGIDGQCATQPKTKYARQSADFVSAAELEDECMSGLGDK